MGITCEKWSGDLQGYLASVIVVYEIKSALNMQEITKTMWTL